MRNTELLEEAGKTATEAIGLLSAQPLTSLRADIIENIRTVNGLNKQLIFHQKYCEHLAEPHRYYCSSHLEDN